MITFDSQYNFRDDMIISEVQYKFLRRFVNFWVSGCGGVLNLCDFSIKIFAIPGHWY